jgi:hypothetical protein
MSSGSAQAKLARPQKENTNKKKGASVMAQEVLPWIKSLVPQKI